MGASHSRHKTRSLQESSARVETANRKKLYIYVLALEENKIYVGVTDNVERRFSQHRSGKGAVWTKRYPPVSIIEIRVVNSPFDEEMVTKEYMSKFGIDDVRGAKYVSMKLPDDQIRDISTSMWSINNKLCQRCGRDSGVDGQHRARYCRESHDINDYPLGG